MAREFLRVTSETTPGTYNAAGTVYVIDLDGNNGFTVRPAPTRVTLRTAGTSNRRAATIAKKMALTGNLNWTVRGSQAALLADWCTADTTLKSYTIDHCLVMEDTGATKIYSRDTGMYAAQTQITSSDQDQFVKAQLQLTGLLRITTITATDFPEPALSTYPSDDFLTFQNATAGLTLHAETRTDISKFQVTIKNILDVHNFVSQWPQKIKYCGRDVDWTSTLSYKSIASRVDYEAQTPVTAGITFDNGANTLVLNMQSANVYSGVADQLDASKMYTQDITLESHLDYAAGTDFAITAT